MVTVRPITPAITAAVLCLLLNGAIAAADEIGGYAEYNYSLLDSKLSDTNGMTKSKSSALNQRYSLTLDKSIFPTIRLSAMGTFDKSSADNDISDVVTTSASSRINTNADLSYTNGIFNGGTGFSRRQETAKSNGVPTPTLFSDSYNARFGWKPDDLPSLDLLYSSFNNYDEHRKAQDNTASTLTLSSRYKPHETMDMNYSTNYSTLNSRLPGLESESLNQSLRLSYNDIFFKERIAVSSSYNIATQDTKTKSRTGFSDEQASKLLDYYVRTDNNIFPITPPSHIIIDNITPTLIPITNVVPSNIALTFNSNAAIFTPTPAYSDHLWILLNDGSKTVNKIKVVVKPVYSKATNSLPDALVALFSSSWKVFSSNDGTEWNQVTMVGNLTRDPLFTSLDGSEAIEANIPPLAARYIKIVFTPVDINPLNPLFASVSTVTFSRLEAYATVAIPSNGRTSSQISGQYNLNLKARLLNTAALFYDFGFNLDHTKSDSQAFNYRYNVINGLNFNHRYSPTLNTSARVAREDAVAPTAGSSSTSASISLSSQTLPTLSQSATYGFREESSAGISRISHSINLSSSAELYRGISLSLSGGGGAVSDSNGSNQKSLSVTSGLNLTPHNTVSINLSASDSQTWASSRGKPEKSSSTQTGNMTATYNPLPAIYLFGSYGINAQTSQKTQTAQSIGGSWAPFRGGSLLLNTSYRENIDNSGNKDNAFVQSLRWNIRSGWYLDVSYLISKNSATFQKTDTHVFNTALRLSL